MKQILKNYNVRLFYKTDQLSNGQNVFFRISDDNGSLLESNLVASEIGSEGVYYSDYVTPNEDCYLLVVGSNNGKLPEAEVLKIGDPLEKVFYTHGTFKTEQEIYYEIYNSSNEVQSSGILTDSGYGLYSVTVEGVSKPWFFEVFPWVERNKS